jgi:hypothetical protein
VLVKKRERVIVLRPEEIDFVEAYGDYVRLRVGQESHLLRGTLTDMEHRLKAAGFVRIHRSRLVNWQRVREFTADRDHDPVVILKSGAPRRQRRVSPYCSDASTRRIDAGVRSEIRRAFFHVHRERRCLRRKQLSLDCAVMLNAQP